MIKKMHENKNKWIMYGYTGLCKKWPFAMGIESSMILLPRLQGVVTLSLHYNLDLELIFASNYFKLFTLTDLSNSDCLFLLTCD